MSSVCLKYSKLDGHEKIDDGQEKIENNEVKVDLCLGR